MGRHDVLLARMPEELAGHARSVVDWLVGDFRDFGEVGQAEIQRMLWIDLPNRWPVSAGEWLRVVEAAGQVMELAGRPSLAVIARSEETAEVLEAYARDRSEGLLAANAAFGRTGTSPPDTDLLTWARHVTAAEANAYDELQRVLEAAIVAGDYAPGAPGWRRRQQALTERWLTSPSRYFDGWRPIDVIHTQRREAWMMGVSPEREQRLAPVVPFLRDPVTVPEGEPATLVWLLNRIGDGVRLTQRGYLPPELAREADERFRWSPMPRPASREVDLPELMELHGIVRGQRLVTKRRDTLRLSARGRSVLLEPVRLWEAAALAWLGEHPYEVAVAEIAAAVLVREPATSAELAAAAHDVVAPDFRTRDDAPVPHSATEGAAWSFLRRGFTLGFVADRPPGARYALNALGRPAALTALRLRAHSPHEPRWSDCG